MVYAEALIGAAEKAGVTDAVVQEFDSFIDDVLEKLPKLEAVLTSGFVDEETKEAMLKKALGQISIAGVSQLSASLGPPRPTRHAAA